MKKPKYPEKIYLQLSYNKSEMTTWCEDKISHDDVCYIKKAKLLSAYNRKSDPTLRQCEDCGGFAYDKMSIEYSKDIRDVRFCPTCNGKGHQKVVEMTKEEMKDYVIEKYYAEDAMCRVDLYEMLADYDKLIETKHSKDEQNRRIK